MRDADKVVQEIRRILEMELQVSRVVLDKLTPETPLLGRGVGLDSMEALTLATALENSFSIQIPDENLSPELFNSLRSLAEFVAVRISTQEPGI